VRSFPRLGFRIWGDSQTSQNPIRRSAQVGRPGEKMSFENMYHKSATFGFIPQKSYCELRLANTGFGGLRSIEPLAGEKTATPNTLNPEPQTPKPEPQLWQIGGSGMRDNTSFPPTLHSSLPTPHRRLVDSNPPTFSCFSSSFLLSRLDLSDTQSLWALKSSPFRNPRRSKPGENTSYHSTRNPGPQNFNPKP